jgi:hypothetical protein
VTVVAWRYAYASVAGTSHTRLNLECQDAADCKVIATATEEPVLVAVVADGAGSAARAAAGARLACEHLLATITDHVTTGGSVEEISQSVVTAWVTSLRAEVVEQANADGAQPRDYACTLLTAVVGPAAAAFFQIGDGVIIVSPRDEPDEFSWVFWPEKGEYENVTVFATAPDALDHLHFGLVTNPVDEVALLTDGLQRLALHMRDQKPHDPFFRPMFAPLRAALPGYLPDLSASLATYLASDAINARTDDDKTLVLATRRQHTAPPPETPDERADRL